MTKLRATTLLVALFVSISAHADTGASDETAAREARFAQLVGAGDRARRAHQHSAAIVNYNDALEIRQDPAIEGRLGLVFLEIGEYPAAAEHLLQAITKAQAPPGLMQQFHAGFARVRPKVCFVEVFVSEAADIEIDGELEPSSRQNAFHVFVTAGPHVFRAKLAGFEDATASIDAPAGGELEVKLDLKPLPPPPPVQVSPMPNPEQTPQVPGKPSVLDKPHKSLSDSYLHFSLGAGLLFVLGATPDGALGPHISGGARRGFFSLNADARVAWALGSPERAADLQLTTWTFALRPCVHYSVLFGCGVLQVDGLYGLSEDSNKFVQQTKFGGGARGGVQFVLRKPVHLRIWAEGIVHASRYEVLRDDGVVWRSWPVAVTFGATTFLTW